MVWTRGTREKFRYRDAAHTDISRAYVQSLSKEEKYVKLPLGMWTGGSPEYGRLMVSLYGTRGPAAILEDACAQVLDQFEGEVACPCSLQSREGGIRVVVHGDDPLSGGTQVPVGVDEEHHEQALRIEAHHDESVQRSWQVAGHAEQEDRLARGWNRVQSRLLGSGRGAPSLCQAQESTIGKD